MAEKMPDSTKPEPGMTRSSSCLDSIYGKGSLELLWENGQLHAHQGGSSSSVLTRMTPSCKGYSIKAIDEGAFNAKIARLSSLYSLMDFPVQRDSALDNSQPNSHQSNDQNSSHLALKQVEDIKTSMFASGSKGPDRSLVINSPKGSQGRQNPLVSDASNMVPKSEETPPPDEQSEAVGDNSIHGSRGQYFNQTSSSVGFRAKGKADTKKYCDEALLESSSLCSLGASDNRNVCSRKHDHSTYLSDNDEEPEDVVKEKPAREGTGVKRSRNAQVHNLCERKRREKINKRMRILKELIPNCNKTDKASMLDDAIEYLKTLKLQLQMMSMGAGFFCMPFMMLPDAAHHMTNTPHLHQLMGLGMGFGPGTTVPCSLPQFPITTLPAITDNRVHFFGFPNQVPPMPISHAPFIPMLGNPSTQTPLATSTAINLAENPDSSQLTTLIASVPKNFYLSGQSEYATKQAPTQVSLHH